MEKIATKTKKNRLGTKVLLVLVGYVWGILYLTVKVFQGHMGAAIPLIAALAVGYYTLKILGKALVFVVKNREALGGLVNIFSNLLYLLDKAVVEKSAPYIRLFNLLASDPVDFKREIDR